MGPQKFLSALLKYVGPGYMVAVGYLDPGNWATDLAAGSQFKYSLLFIVLLSSIMAIILQSLCIRLGLATGYDLAQACRQFFPKWAYIILYVLAEIAIIATDLAEVIGSAIALNLLFGIPLLWGVLITCSNVLVLLFGWGKSNHRIFEVLMLIFVVATASCLFALLAIKPPVFVEVLQGYLPSSIIFTDQRALFLAMGIVGATVMPHNLYLHSSIVKFRMNDPVDTGDNAQTPQSHPLLENSTSNETAVPQEPPLNINDLDNQANASVSSSSNILEASPVVEQRNLKMAIKMTTIDCLIALSFALLVNSSILILAGVNLFGLESAGIEGAHHVISQTLGSAAATLFAVGLLFAGQSSTITGTIAGQIVIEGFLGKNFIPSPALRGLITRLISIVPALIAILLGKDVEFLLVISQVILSLQLPFAVWPLIYFNFNAKITHPDSQAGWPIRIVSIIIALLITALNLKVVIDLFY
jgi:manganese transport protein